MTVAEEVTDRQFNFERAKLEQEGGGGDLEVWVGAGIGVPLLVISISLLARNLWLANENRRLLAREVTPHSRLDDDRGSEEKQDAGLNHQRV